MASKYADVMVGMPKLRASKSEYDDPSYQQRVEEEKARLREGMAEPGPEEYARAWAAARTAKDLLESQESSLNLSLEALAQLIADAYEAKGLQSLKLADGTTVAVQPEPQPVIKDKEGFRRWCLDSGLGGAMTLPWQTAAALTKERLLAGQPCPDGVEANVRNKLVLTKGKGSKAKG